MDTSLPPFPAHIPTHPLFVIDYELLQAGDKREIDRLWEAGKKIGFWYLKNHGANLEANAMFDAGEEVMAITAEEKMKFEQGDDGFSFGYKAVGAYLDANGEPDAIEFLNIGKDDVIAWPRQAARAYPPVVKARMESTVVPFVRKSLDITTTILNILNDKLGLPSDTLMNKHIVEDSSKDEVRITRAPPFTQGMKMSLNGHTDFGSLSFLHNRLGGLQVLPPGSDTWQYIKPVPGHAICNLGDAMSIFSGGILRSNLHRVVSAPGPQGGHPRWSVVYFSRPADHVVLRALVEDSAMIAQAVKMTPERNFETGSTSKQWVERRVKYLRAKNRKTPESWLASHGTESSEYHAQLLKQPKVKV